MSYAKKNIREAAYRGRDLAFGIFSIGASLVVGLYFAKALWALPFIWIMGYCLCDYVLSFAKRSTSVTVAVNLIFTVLFTCLIWSAYLKSEYHRQEAAKTEGDLEPLPPNGEADSVNLQIGKDGPQFVRNVPGNIAQIVMPLESLKIAYDAGLAISRGPKGLEISTPVIDNQGNLVAEIVSNHWKVYPPCSDKNYTKNSLEIKDRAGHVVLQVTLYRNKIQLQGEWHTSLGQGERLESVPGYGGITLWLKPEDEKKFPFLIKPMFAYPSSQHWGELAAKTP